MAENQKQPKKDHEQAYFDALQAQSYNPRAILPPKRGGDEWQDAAAPLEQVSNGFYDDPDVRARARNTEHLDLLVDDLVARQIQEHLPDDATDEEYQWAQANRTFTRTRLHDFEANGYQHPNMPDQP